MVFKNRGLSRSLASLVYVTLVLLQPSVRQNSSESVAGNHDNTGLTGPSPTAFLILRRTC
jgi:preprotein translocase subunit SecG